MTQPFKQRERVKLSDMNPEYPSHVWVFWKSPIPQVYMDLLYPWVIARDGDKKPTAKEEEAALENYCAAVSELVLDTGESGIDLSTPEAVRTAMTDLSIDGELLRGILIDYINRIVERRTAQSKKAVERSERSGDSGSLNGKENTSPIVTGAPP